MLIKTARENFQTVFRWFLQSVLNDINVISIYTVEIGQNSSDKGRINNERTTCSIAVRTCRLR